VLKIEKHAIEKERRENLFCSLFFLDIITNLNGILKTIAISKNCWLQESQSGAYYVTSFKPKGQIDL